MASASAALDDSLLAAIADRRLALRVPVSLAVVVYDGVRRRRAELVDLSLTGCRARFQEPVTADRSPWLWLPAGLGGRFAHPIGTEVAWTDSLPGAPTGHCQVGMRFRRLPFGGLARVQRALSELLTRVALAEPLAASPERRGASRVSYERRVISRGAGAPRVMLGRDLSQTGIRVESRQPLPAGARLQIALHAGGKVPLVVRAEVVRGAPEGGAALAFRDLTPAQRDALDEILGELLAPQEGGGSSLVVSALLDPGARLPE